MLNILTEIKVNAMYYFDYQQFLFIFFVFYLTSRTITEKTYTGLNSIHFKNK